MKYLYSKDNTVFAECENCGRVLKFEKYKLSEIITGVECFCGNNSNTIHNLPQSNNSIVDNTQRMMSNGSSQVLNTSHTSETSTSEKNASNTPQFTPKCPTCGSSNIQKISFASKAVGGYMWGIFSSNVRNTFKCNNCGYKW